MRVIVGDFNEAKIFTDNIEDTASSQIENLLNQEAFRGSKIRIMPDVHAGAGCVIGFTGNLGDKVIPNIVGVDIGCGMFCIKLGNFHIDLAKLDYIINKLVPSGFDIHAEPKFNFKEELNELYCLREISRNGWSVKKWNRQIGTLGGGNHFIEVNTDSENNKYLVIHSGSRNLGKKIADYYQNLAIDLCSGKETLFKEKDELIKIHKANGTRNLIQSELRKLENKYKASTPSLPRELCYLSGQYRDMYLHDMKIAQDFAIKNREVMSNIILSNLGILDENLEQFHTVHNYIDFSSNIIRKGAVSASSGEQLLIPMNMRDGSLLCKGKGNHDWNSSAPHGAGRIMSRSKARKSVNMKEYALTMSGVYTTSVNNETIDEAPMVYKPMQEIIDNIGETVDIIDILKPIYNYKAH